MWSRDRRRREQATLLSFAAAATISIGLLFLAAVMGVTSGGLPIAVAAGSGLVAGVLAGPAGPHAGRSAWRGAWTAAFAVLLGSVVFAAWQGALPRPGAWSLAGPLLLPVVPAWFVGGMGAALTSPRTVRPPANRYGGARATTRAEVRLPPENRPCRPKLDPAFPATRPAPRRRTGGTTRQIRPSRDPRPSRPGPSARPPRPTRGGPPDHLRRIR